MRTWGSEGLGALDGNVRRGRLGCHPRCFSGIGSPGSTEALGCGARGSGTLHMGRKSLTVFPPFPWTVLSIDRMEHPSPSRGTHRYPRYHSNLFRGQDAWDPHTHVLLPSQSPWPSPHEGESPWVTLGQALFPQARSHVALLPILPLPDPCEGLSCVTPAAHTWSQHSLASPAPAPHRRWPFQAWDPGSNPGSPCSLRLHPPVLDL